MLRPVSLLPALVAVATLATLLLVPAAGLAGTGVRAASVRASAPTPLAVTIDSMSSSTVPERGPIQVTGSVTNNDTGTWTTINVYAFISSTPMTTAAELADAAATPATVEVGQRIIGPGTYDTIDRIDPGDTAYFTITVPHADLRVSEAGVYWFGVHALGQGPEGRIDGADGRARTFLPYIPPTRKSVDAALVVPIRRQITHAADGSVAQVASWTKSLSPGGALRSLVDLGVAAGSRPITWLVDPAVPDTVRRLAAGNPPRSLAPTVSTGGDGGNGEASPSPDPSASPTDGGGTDGDGAGADPGPVAAKAAAAATSWLERFHDGLSGKQLLALPYGDVDVAGAAAHNPAWYREARNRSGDELQPWGLPMTPAVSSPSGYLDAAGIGLAEPSASVIVTDRMFGANAPSVARVDGHTLAVASSGAASGGPGPTERRAPLALRQRILSEAAVRLLTRGRKPLIMVFPPTWSPHEPVSGFFQGLDVSWLHLTTLDTATQRAGTDVPLDRLEYPDNQRKLQLNATNFTAAEDLVRDGDVLQNLLTQNDRVGGEVRDEAMADTSYSSRLRPESARASAERSRAWIDAKLRSVRIDAPRAVILASGSGRFAATVTNTLDEPVTVRIQAVADPPLKVAVPRDSVDLGPQSRTTILLNATSSALGIRNVTLVLTDSDEVPLGSSDDVPIRSNRVSNVIWLIIGTGVALLFGAIVVRLFRRIRSAARS